MKEAVEMMRRKLRGTGSGKAKIAKMGLDLGLGDGGWAKKIKKIDGGGGNK